MGDTGVAATCTEWARTLLSDHASEEAIHLTINFVFGFCDVSEPDWQSNQRLAVQCGVVDGCAKLAMAHESVHIRMIALVCARQLCFECEDACQRVAAIPGLLEHCAAVARSGEALVEHREESVTLASAAAYSFPQHPRVLHTFLATLLACVRDSNNPKVLRQACVCCLNNLAYNTGSHAELLAGGAVDVLTQVIDTHDRQLFHFDAAIAVANLCPNHPAIANDAELVNTMLHALERTLRHQDYPPNTGWFYTDHKLMMGISNICRNRDNCALMRRDLPVLIRVALLHNPSPLLVRHAVTTLWRLAS